MTTGAMTTGISLVMIVFGVWVCFLDNWRFGLILIMFGVAVMYSEYRRWSAEMDRQDREWEAEKRQINAQFKASEEER
jgi:membrane protein implicated in regulation of membrane protease activity